MFYPEIMSPIKMKNKILFIAVTFVIATMIITPIILSNRPQPTSENKKACLSLTFDDGLESHYTKVLPLLQQYNYQATFFVSTNPQQESSREVITDQQIKSLIENGNEIGSHTVNHLYLTSLDEKELETELSESKRILEEKFGIEVRSLALPYGDYNERVLEKAKKHYLTARTIFDNDNKFLIKGLALTRDTKPESICESIQLAKDNNSWLVLILHDITYTPKIWDTSTEDFTKILDCINKAEIEVDTLWNCKRRLP